MNESLSASEMFATEVQSPVPVSPYQGSQACSIDNKVDDFTADAGRLCCEFCDEGCCQLILLPPLVSESAVIPFKAVFIQHRSWKEPSRFDLSLSDSTCHVMFTERDLNELHTTRFTSQET